MTGLKMQTGKLLWMDIILLAVWVNAWKICHGTGNFHEILHMLNIICCWCEENDVEVYTMMISDGKILNSDRLGDGKYLLKTHGRIFAIEKSY